MKLYLAKFTKCFVLTITVIVVNHFFLTNVTMAEHGFNVNASSDLSKDFEQSLQQQVEIPTYDNTEAKNIEESESVIQEKHQSEINKNQDVKTIMVPSGTVLNIALENSLRSDRNNEGETVQAKITQPVYIGPYLIISQGAYIRGKITRLNNAGNKKEPHPYMILSFNELKRAVDPASIPFSGTLIAYKTGLRGHEYVWKLPEKGDRARNNLKGAMMGAVSGAFLNPVFGPVIGAGASLLKSTLFDRLGRGGEINLKAGEEIPIAVEESFAIPTESNAGIKTEDRTIDEKKSDTVLLPKNVTAGKPYIEQLDDKMK